MKINKLGYCGLFCGACELFLATKNNTLSKIAKEKNIKEELLECKGCKSTVTSINCRNCSIKKCCIQKGISVCAECNEFPCSVLKAFENDHCPHHKGLIESQKAIKKIGIDDYIKKQETIWKCPKCNKPYSWYENKCSGCESDVDGYTK